MGTWLLSELDKIDPLVESSLCMGQEANQKYPFLLEQVEDPSLFQATEGLNES